MDFPDGGSATVSIDAELTALRALVRQDKFADALAAGKALLAHAPEQREALLLAASRPAFLGSNSRCFRHSCGA